MSETLYRKSLNLPDRAIGMVEQMQEADGLNFTDAIIKLIEYGYFLHTAVREEKDVQVDGKGVVLL